MSRFLFLLLLLLPLAARAHLIGEIPLLLEVDGNKLTGTFEVDAAYMLPEFRGDEQDDPKDLLWLREQGPAGWKKIEEASKLYFQQSLRLEADGRPLTWQMEIPEFRDAKPAFMTIGEVEELPIVEIVFHAELPADASKLEAAWKESYKAVLVVTVRQGDKANMTPIVPGDRATLLERQVAATAPGQAPSEEIKPVSNSLGRWVMLGFRHILPKGFDHILFVLGLFLLAPKWKPLLQQTIIFTIAHSVSLAVAALGWVDLSSPNTVAWIEVLICTSIAWVGIENLLVKELGKGRLALVGVFGLIHGLGFAGGLPRNQPEEIPAALFGFNVGVELAQITVILAAFALFGWWKGDFKWIRRIGSSAVGVVGLVLVVKQLMRMF